MAEHDPLIEALAELEHDQWREWSRELVVKENLSLERTDRWERFWVPYSELPEDAKEHDRVWARKVIDVFNNHFHPYLKIGPI